MSKVKDIYNTLFGIKNEFIYIDETKKPSKDKIVDKTSVDAYEYREPQMFGVTLNDWKRSVDQAWSEVNPNRTQLCDIYKAMTSYDSQTITAIQQRKLLTMQGELAFYNEDGSINEEATKVIVSPSGSTNLWLRDFISASLDSIFWGYEVISINIIDGKIFIKKVPERNIIPRDGVILKDASFGYSDNNVIRYNEGKVDLITCKVSYTNDLNDLGLLSGCAPYFFSKVTGSWKAHADKFGMLTRVLTTSSENKTKLNASYNALKNQVRGNFIVLGQDDKLTFEGDTRTDVTMYSSLNSYCDASISKIILGQTSTTDEKSFAGSAGVHQDILNSIIKSDREFVEAIINDQLVPKLQMFGLLPKGIYFGISSSENIDLVQQATIVKTLSDSGFKVTPEYIKKTFNVELVENQPIVEPTPNTNI